MLHYGLSCPCGLLVHYDLYGLFGQYNLYVQLLHYGLSCPCNQFVHYDLYNLYGMYNLSHLFVQLHLCGQ